MSLFLTIRFRQKEVLLAAKDKVDETRVFTLNAKHVLKIMGNR